MIRIIWLYIDPGSGSYLVQVIIAGVLAVVLYFKNGWIKIKSFFSKNKKDDPSKDDLT
jgi:hypothetical protein